MHASARDASHLASRIHQCETIARIIARLYLIIDATLDMA